MVFWISVVGIFYLYFGYPIILLITSKFKKHPPREEAFTPNVSVIIAAYNEEEVIGQRIENIMASDYPKDKIEVIVSSDGSTDRTNEIVRTMAYKYGNVKLVASKERGGKSAALNRAVPKAKGEVLVFTDANSVFEPSSLRVLVKPLSDEKVGCVAGRKVIYGKDKNKEAEEFYWKYENFLKSRESLIHSCMGADGSIYALRKELYCFPDPNRGYADDGMISMYVISKGYRLIYEPKARAWETSSSSLWREYRRKIRTLSGGLEWMASLWKLLIPFKSPVWWQLWSHKLLRFIIPFSILGIVLSSGFLTFGNAGFTVYHFSFASLLFVYAIGALAILGCKRKLCRICFYFGYMNFSFLSALVRFISRKTEVTWEKLGRSDHE